MTIYYSLTFLLLASEMISFCIFVAPLPHKIRRKLFRFLSESPIVAKVSYGVKISFIFVGVLFVDALQRMFRIDREMKALKFGGQGMQDLTRPESSQAARKFYAQRNVYLTGFCLFLSVVLTRTFYMIRELIRIQDEHAQLKKATASTSRNNLVADEQTKENERLKQDLETLRAQAKSQAAEYDRLAEQYNRETGNSASDKRVD